MKSNNEAAAQRDYLGTINLDVQIRDGFKAQDFDWDSDML